MCCRGSACSFFDISHLVVDVSESACGCIYTLLELQHVLIAESVGELFLALLHEVELLHQLFFHQPDVCIQDSSSEIFFLIILCHIFSWRHSFALYTFYRALGEEVAIGKKSRRMNRRELKFIVPRLVWLNVTL